MLDRYIQCRALPENRLVQITRQSVIGCLAAAFAFSRIGRSWDETKLEMATQTGATGAELDGLMKSVQNVSGTVRGSMNEIGEVVSDLASTTSLRGKPLEELAKDFLSLRELSVALDPAETVATLASWGVADAQMHDALERIFRISQESGQPIPTLIDRLKDLRRQPAGQVLDFETASLAVAQTSG
jgi:phage-related minor tail protein